MKKYVINLQSNQVLSGKKFSIFLMSCFVGSTVLVINSLQSTERHILMDQFVNIQ